MHFDILYITLGYVTNLFGEIDMQYYDIGIRDDPENVVRIGILNLNNTKRMPVGTRLIVSSRIYAILLDSSLESRFAFHMENSLLSMRKI